MPTTPRSAIKAKARGFTISIGKMNEKERLQQPSGAFGDDYNRLVAAARTALPDVAVLLPPTVEMTEGAYGGRVADSSYREIDGYCEQIYQLAADNE